MDDYLKIGYVKNLLILILSILFLCGSLFSSVYGQKEKDKEQEFYVLIRSAIEDSLVKELKGNGRIKVMDVVNLANKAVIGKDSQLRTKQWVGKHIDKLERVKDHLLDSISKAHRRDDLGDLTKGEFPTEKDAKGAVDSYLVGLLQESFISEKQRHPLSDYRFLLVPRLKSFVNLFGNTKYSY